MKNSLFFAGLAAATLLFVGCNKEADVRGLDATPFKVSLSFGQTRTVTDGVKTHWAEGDQINVFHAEAGTTDYRNDTPYVDRQGHPYVVSDTEAGTFTGTLMGGDLESGKSYDWYFYYPYNTYLKSPVNESDARLYIGGRSDQPQTQNGYNSRLHLAGGTGAACFPLYGIAKDVPASTQPAAVMKHIASVVAVTVTNDTDKGITISHLEFTAPEPVVGNFFISFDKEPLTIAPYESQASATASLQVENATVLAAGAKATFYMGIKPFSAKVGDKLALKITADAGVVEKEIELTTAAEFKAGYIKPVNVSYKAASTLPTVTVNDIKSTFTSSTETSFEGILAGATVTFVSGNNAFMEDETGGILLYQSGHTFKAGDLLSGIVSGKGKNYNGLKEMTSLSVETVTPGQPVPAPVELTLAQLNADYAEYESISVKLKGVTIAADFDNRNTTMTDGDESLALRDQVKNLTVTPGKYDVIGFPSYYNNPQFGVWAQDNIIAAGTVNIFTVTPVEINVPASATTATIEVGGNVEWSAIPPVGVTLDQTAGNGPATVTASFAPNTDTVNPKEYIIFFHTDAEGVEDDEPTVTITQAKAASSDDPRFVKVTSISDLTDGKYLIVNETAKVALKDAVDESKNTITVTISDDVIAATEEVTAVAFTFTASDGAFQGANGKYLAHSGTKNTINPTDTPSENTISISDGNAIISASDDYFIQYNKTSGQERFRYYKNAQTDGDIQLYKFVGDGGTVPSYSFGATLDAAEVAATATEATVNVTGNVAWTASVTTGATVTPASGTGEGTVKVTFPANTDTENAKTYTVTVSTTADVPTKSIDLTITQAKAVSAVVKEFPYEETFASSQGDFTIDNVLMDEPLTYVWTHDSKNKYMKASAYKDKTNYPSESWLISPVIDMAGAASPALSFSHVISTFFKDVTTEATVWIKEEGGSWNQLSITYPDFPEGKNFSNWGEVTVDLSSYAGKKVQVGFKYVSTSTNAGTWEVKNFKVAEETAPALSFGATLAAANVAATATEATVNVTGNVAWTASVSSGATVSPASGTGEGTVKVTFPANTDTGNAKTYTVTVATTADVEVKSFDLTITQAKAEAAGTVTIDWTSASEWTGIGNEEISLTKGDYLVTIQKNGGSTNPTVNGTYNDARAYAKATVTVKNTKNVNMTSLVFNISTAGLKRLAPITASVGTVAAQTKGDNTVSWSGEAVEVTFTVGDKADYGSDGSDKAGQLCFDNIKVAEGGQGLPSYSFGATLDAANVEATATEATVTVTGNVAWTASVSSGATVSPASGNGAGTVTVSFPANTDTENAKTYKVTVSTTADVPDKSFDLTITQAKASSPTGGDEVRVVFDQDYLAANKEGSKDGISYENTSDYGSTVVTELRVYKGKQLVVSTSEGHTITRIEMTCTKNGSTKEGPGCWGAGAPEGYTFETSGPTGTWTGSASSVTFTATDNQVRIKELVVTYK